ncbi:hypothetical protein AK812_SmicGene46251, partial [Symbiodinium microadriaticum]
ARASVNSISENGHSPLSAVRATGRRLEGEKMVRSLLHLRADPASWHGGALQKVVPSKPSHFKAVVSALLNAAADPSSAVPGQPCLADGTLSRRPLYYLSPLVTSTRHEDVAQLLFEARAAEDSACSRSVCRCRVLFYLANKDGAMKEIH